MSNETEERLQNLESLMINMLDEFSLQKKYLHHFKKRLHVKIITAIDHKVDSLQYSVDRISYHYDLFDKQMRHVEFRASLDRIQNIEARIYEFQRKEIERNPIDNNQILLDMNKKYREK